MTPRTPPALHALAACQAVLAPGAIAGGAALAWRPDGSVMGLPVSLLAGTPFPDFLAPGLILGLAIGLGSAVAAAGLWTRPEWRWLRPLQDATQVHWAWTLAFLEGVALLVWLAVQLFVASVPFTGFHVFYGLLGLVILALCFAPGVRARLARPRPRALQAG
ncbi:MAG TPA: hypothetical protein VHN99_08160 [Deinococcales bacterium]|nr:hypothetical protein [Deinococcales bacterium]